MNKEQINFLRNLYTKESTRPDGRKSTNAEYMRFHFDGGIAFLSTKECILYDDDNELLNAIGINPDFSTQGDFPLRIVTAPYEAVNQVEVVMSKKNFFDYLDSCTFINNDQKEFIANYVDNLLISPNFSKNNAVPFMNDPKFIGEYNNKNETYEPLDTVLINSIDFDTYKAKALTGELNGKGVLVNISNQTFENGLNLPNVQNVENPPILYLVIKNCNFTGVASDKKQIYVANAKRLIVSNCTFSNGGVDNYSIDVNQCSIKDSSITIENCNFVDCTNVKSAIKISARMGYTDHPDDITVTEPATIKEVKIYNCKFNDSTVSFTKGTTPKGTDTSANLSTGDYKATISRCGPVFNYKLPYLYNKDKEAEMITVKNNSTFII